MEKGYQLFSAAALCQTAGGLRGTIEKIAKMGYDGVEFFDYAGTPSLELKRILDGCGIKGLNVHVPLDRWQQNLDAEIAYALEAGIPMLTIPWLPPDKRIAEMYTLIVNNVPFWVEKCAKYGLQAGYHNHDFEYADFDGKNVLDTILQADDKLLLELDTFWAMYAGADPESEMEKYKDRMPLIHVKDYLDMRCDPPVFCAIGHGKMDESPILEKAKALNLAWVVVEQDNSTIDVLESARLSLQTLEELLP